MYLSNHPLAPFIQGLSVFDILHDRNAIATGLLRLVDIHANHRSGNRQSLLDRNNLIKLLTPKLLINLPPYTYNTGRGSSGYIPHKPCPFQKAAQSSPQAQTSRT